MEIKFRGKRVNNGEWVYGFYCELKDLVGHISIANWVPKYYIISLKARLRDNEYGDFNLDGVFEVIPETVGQFIGLSDKKGIGIYKGDIVIIQDEYDNYEQEYDDLNDE